MITREQTFILNYDFFVLFIYLFFSKKVKLFTTNNRVITLKEENIFHKKCNTS